VVIPFGAGIGDLMLQRGLLAGIRRRWPVATVSLYAPARAGAYVPAGVRVLTRVLGIPAWDRVRGSERWWRLLGPMEWRAIDVTVGRIPLARVAHLPAQALAQRFDLVIDFLGAFADGVDVRRVWLPPTAGRTTVHVVDLLAGYLATLGVDLPVEDRVQPMPLSHGDERWATDFLASFAPACTSARGQHAPGERSMAYALVNPHAGSSLKLPGERFWQVLVRGLQRGGLTPLVVAGGDDREAVIARRIAAAGGAALPRVPIPRLTALARRCHVTISPDTGLLHVVAQDGGRWVGLFGATNPYLTGPYDRARGRLVVAEPPRGRPCLTCWQRFTVGSACCPIYPAGSCLSTLDPSQVVREALSLAADGLPLRSPNTVPDQPITDCTP
jgi:ADP-heptose:LPS heptosyltransferase